MSGRESIIVIHERCPQTAWAHLLPVHYIVDNYSPQMETKTAWELLGPVQMTLAAHQTTPPPAICGGLMEILICLSGKLTRSTGQLHDLNWPTQEERDEKKHCLKEQHFSLSKNKNGISSNGHLITNITKHN